MPLWIIVTISVVCSLVVLGATVAGLFILKAKSKFWKGFSHWVVGIWHHQLSYAFINLYYYSVSYCGIAV